MTSCAAEGQAVCLEGLVMRFGKGREAVTALDGVNAVIPAGRITGLVGPDAAGKTTLMRIMAGLMPPSEGRASLFGHSPAELKNLPQLTSGARGSPPMKRVTRGSAHIAI